ncbi:MAG: glycosyltransferase family 4 protein [Solirubrobacterales bacterium]
MSILALHSRSFLQGLNSRFAPRRALVPLEGLSRVVRHDKRRVFYRYRYSVRPVLHPVLIPNFTHPPLRYCTRREARLYHWWHSPDVIDETPFVLEPLDHVFAPTREGNPGNAIRMREELRAFYADDRCRRVLITSTGQLELFRYYFPEFDHKFTVVPPGCTPRLSGPSNSNAEPVFLCVATVYAQKAVDLVVDAWTATATGGARLVLVCADFPPERVEGAERAGIEIIGAERPLRYRAIQRLYEDADVAIVPLHTDALGAYMDAIAHGLPIIAMRSQHSADFTAKGAGLECDVPLYLYDPEGFGVRWSTWEEFMEQVTEAKRQGLFIPTVEQLSSAIERLLDPATRTEMSERAADLCRERFHVDRRNALLRSVYEAAV